MSSANDYDTQVRSRLAAIRKQRGVAAAELARQAGVGRQTIYAMEAGEYLPNTVVALKLARALGVTVEELFCLDVDRAEAPPAVAAELIGPGERFAGSPIELCRVDGKMVGVPAAPAPWRLTPADGLLAHPASGVVQLLHQGFDEPRLLMAGCDPATPVLARRLERASVGLVTAAVNSSVALDLLRQRLVHVAGTHLKDEASGESNRAAVRAQFPRRGVAVFAFAVWEEGLVVARGNPKKIRSVADLARAGVRLANREKGSGSRQLLDRELKKAGVAARAVAGYGEAPAAGHLAAAWRVHTGLAEACVATRSAALAFGLGFVPLASERYDLVVREEHLDLVAVGRLLDTLTQAAFRHELGALCGYDTRETGRRVV